VLWVCLPIDKRKIAYLSLCRRVFGPSRVGFATWTVVLTAQPQ
jgi:hypothetical protein